MNPPLYFQDRPSEVRPGCPHPALSARFPLPTTTIFPFYSPSFRKFLFPLFSIIPYPASFTLHLPFISIPLSGLFLPSPVGFIRCKGLLPRLIRQLEMNFPQILPFGGCERVIGWKSRRMKLFRQSGTASIKSQAVQAGKRTEPEGNKII